MRPGVAAVLHRLHGQSWAPTVTDLPAEGVSRLPVSSTALLRMVAVPTVAGVHEYVHAVRPLAGRQVTPPSTDTSTPATAPPPKSLAVPEITTAFPARTVAPAAGDVIVDTGALESVDFAAGTNPG